MRRPTNKEELGMQLITVSRRYRRVMDAALSDFGLTDATTLPLRYLALLDHGIRQTDLAEVLDIEGPTLVHVLDQLMEMGLVERIEDPSDRRAKLASATRKGRDLHVSFEVRLDGARERIFDGVSKDDINTTLRLLKSIETNLQTTFAADD